MRWQAFALAVLALLNAPLQASGHAHHDDGSAAPLVDLTYTIPSAVEHAHHAGGHDCAFDKITRAVHREPLPDGASGPRRRLSELGLAKTHQNYGNVEDEHGRRLQSTTYQKLRLVVDTSLLEANADSFACSAAGQTIQYTLAGSSNDSYVCKAEDVLTAAKRAFIRDTLIPAAVDFLTASLSVIPVSGNLINSSPLPDGSCFNDGLGYWYSLVCCARFWPTRFSNPGVANADFLLVLSARPTRGNLLAWATECQSDQYFRPISGQANLSPAKVNTDASAFQFQLSVILHEICHAIGFNQDKLFNFRQPGSLSQSAPYSSVVFSGFDPLLQKDVTKVISPKVVAAAKAHYGCYSDWINPGMELEDGGAGGTRGSHWEKRLAMYELMNGVSELAMYRSSLTLAFFEDSGWYSVDYSRSETLPWGNGEGCNFVAKRCNNWDSRYFCSVQGQIGCTSDARFQAFCTYSQDSLSRPSSFQYFDSPQKGGTSDIPDYCPFYQAYSNRDCQNSATTAYFFYGESPGTFSKCFHGTYQLASTVTTLQRHAGCLRYRCGPANSLIAILGFNSGFQLEVPCPKAGGDVDVSALPGSQWAGTINCPRSDVICTGDACALNPTCDGHGVCDKLNGTCSCAAGYYGSTPFSCDLKRCPTATPGQDCSGNGVCNPQQGYCMKDATAGRPGCATGYTGDDCSARGCPTDANGLSCSGPTRGTCNNQTAVCSCLPGFVGEACELKECSSVNSTLCGGTAPACSTTAPSVSDTVTCSQPGEDLIDVPSGATKIELTVVGGGGGQGNAAGVYGANAWFAEGGGGGIISGLLNLPANTAKVKVIVGAKGASDYGSTTVFSAGGGGGASALAAYDANGNWIDTIAIAGGGGGGGFATRYVSSAAFGYCPAGYCDPPRGGLASNTPSGFAAIAPANRTTYEAIGLFDSIGIGYFENFPNLSPGYHMSTGYALPPTYNGQGGAAAPFIPASLTTAGDWSRLYCDQTQAQSGECYHFNPSNPVVNSFMAYSGSNGGDVQSLPANSLPIAAGGAPVMFNGIRASGGGGSGWGGGASGNTIITSALSPARSFHGGGGAGGGNYYKASLATNGNVVVRARERISVLAPGSNNKDGFVSLKFFNGAPAATPVPTPSPSPVAACGGASATIGTPVTCTNAGEDTITVPAGANAIYMAVTGGGGGKGVSPSFSVNGGGGGKVTGTFALPPGTAKVKVIVGDAGATYGSSGVFGGGAGGRASAVAALDSSNNVLATFAVGGGGGGGGYAFNSSAFPSAGRSIEGGTARSAPPSYLGLSSYPLSSSVMDTYFGTSSTQYTLYVGSGINNVVSSGNTVTAVSGFTTAPSGSLNAGVGIVMPPFFDGRGALPAPLCPGNLALSPGNISCVYYHDYASTGRGLFPNFGAEGQQYFLGKKGANIQDLPAGSIPIAAGGEPVDLGDGIRASGGGGWGWGGGASAAVLLPVDSNGAVWRQSGGGSGGGNYFNPSLLIGAPAVTYTTKSSTSAGGSNQKGAVALTFRAPCNGATATLGIALNCPNPGEDTIAVPAGATAVMLDVIGAGGGQGFGAQATFGSGQGGSGAKLTGTFALPAGTASVKVIVGAPGATYQGGLATYGGGGGGQASAVAALASDGSLLGTLVIAGGGGGGGHADLASALVPSGGGGNNSMPWWSGADNYPFAPNSLQNSNGFGTSALYGFNIGMGPYTTSVPSGFTVQWYSGVVLPPFRDGSGALAAPYRSTLTGTATTDATIVFVTNGVAGTDYILGSNGGSVQDLPAGSIPIAAGGAPVNAGDGLRSSGGGGSGYGGGASGAVVLPLHTSGRKRLSGGGSGGGNFFNNTLAMSGVTYTMPVRSATSAGGQNIGGAVMLTFNTNPSATASTSPTASTSASSVFSDEPSPSSSASTSVSVIYSEPASPSITTSPSITPSISATPAPTFLTVNTESVDASVPSCPANYQRGSDGRCYALGSASDGNNAARFCAASRLGDRKIFGSIIRHSGPGTWLPELNRAATPVALAYDWVLAPPAVWVWSAPQSPYDGGRVVFQEMIDEVPCGDVVDATLTLAVDNVAEISFNGIKVGSLSNVIQDNFRRLHSFDLRPYLWQGRSNTLTVDVVDHGAYGGVLYTLNITVVNQRACSASTNSGRSIVRYSGPSTWLPEFNRGAVSCTRSDSWVMAPPAEWIWSSVQPPNEGGRAVFQELIDDIPCGDVVDATLMLAADNTVDIVFNNVKVASLSDVTELNYVYLHRFDLRQFLLQGKSNNLTLDVVDTGGSYGGVLFTLTITIANERACQAQTAGAPLRSVVKYSGTGTWLPELNRAATPVALAYDWVMAPPAVWVWSAPWSDRWGGGRNLFQETADDVPCGDIVEASLTMAVDDLAEVSLNGVNITSFSSLVRENYVQLHRIDLRNYIQQGKSNKLLFDVVDSGGYGGLLYMLNITIANPRSCAFIPGGALASFDSAEQAAALLNGRCGYTTGDVSPFWVSARSPFAMSYLSSPPMTAGQGCVAAVPLVDGAMSLAYRDCSDMLPFCCVAELTCGGAPCPSATPSPSVTASPSASLSVSPSVSPSVSSSPSVMASVSSSASVMPSSSISPSLSPSVTRSPSTTPSVSPTPSPSRRPGISIASPTRGGMAVRGAPIRAEWYGLQRCEENTVSITLVLPTYKQASGNEASAPAVSWNNNAPAELVLAEKIKGCLGSIDVVIPDFLAPGDGYSLAIRVETGYIFGAESDTVRISVVNSAAGLSCEESQPWRIVSGKVLQKRWGLPGTALTLPLRVDGLPWSKLLAARPSIVTALQVDVARMLSIVAPGRSGSVRPLDVDVDFTRSGPATVDPLSSASGSLASAFILPADIDGDLFGDQAANVRIPSSNASVLSVSVFFSAAEYGSTAHAREAARFAATVVSRFIPGFGDAQGIPSSPVSAVAPRVNDVLAWFVEAASRAARLSALEGLDARAYGIEVSIDKGFNAAPSSLDKNCFSFAQPGSNDALPSASLSPSPSSAPVVPSLLPSASPSLVPVTWFRKAVNESTPTMNRWSVVALTGLSSFVLGKEQGAELYSTNNYGASFELLPANGTLGPSINWRALCGGGRELIGIADGHPIYVSSDGGRQWTAKGPSRDYRKLSCHFGGGRALAAAYYDSLQLTEDGGQSWISVGPSKRWGAVAWGSIVAFAAVDEGEIWRSVDGGLTWAELSGPNTPPPSRWNAMATSGDGARVVLASPTTGIWLGTDSGTTWTQTFPHSRSYRWQTVACVSACNIIIAGAKLSPDEAAEPGFVGLTKSRDFGATWDVQRVEDDPSPRAISGHNWKDITIFGDATVAVAVDANAVAYLTSSIY